MNVTQYTFQSPSSSQVQVGRLDLSSVEKEKPQETKKDAEPVVTTAAPQPIEEYLPTGTNLLDVYA
ncbi:hypothetical protein [Sulfurimonas sp.]|jgi:hypothetical protein|uniref:hypothetical protein n=1 Tax=Sulfurimonas sp. TaxID=2022749 RepID=UPI0025FDFCBF|nr:hypothetical protein [Sulfurimonas sp.]MBT5935195.1 hypothetical protein [Sulfurimonas sp.]